MFLNEKSFKSSQSHEIDFFGVSERVLVITWLLGDFNFPNKMALETSLLEGIMKAGKIQFDRI